jgi:hypothetical protein
MGRLLLLLAVFAIPVELASAESSPNPKDLAIPPAELARAKDLVVKLGSEDFDEREDAQDNLAKMGRLAMPALLEGLNSNPSPEVRSRCQSLLPKASHEDLESRLATFLADVDGKYEHDLPGWNEFKKTVGGSTSGSRTVFVELLKNSVNRTLVLAVAGPPSELGTLIAARKQEVYHMRFPRTPNAVRKEQSVTDVIALMFAESHIESKYVPRTISNTTIYNIAGLHAAASDGSDKAAVYKAVVGHWIESRDDAISMNMAMSQAISMNMPKQGNAVAAKLVQLKYATPFYRMNAALALAKNKATDHLPAIEGAFDDEASQIIRQVVVNGKIEGTAIQVRDVALAAALLLTKQKPEDYGLVEQYKNQPGMEYTYTNWRLPEDKRKAAFEKWKAWRAKNQNFGKIEEKK